MIRLKCRSDMHLCTAISLLVCQLYGIFGLEQGNKSEGTLRDPECFVKEEDQPCVLTILNKTGIYLKVKYSEFKPDVAHFTLSFPNKSIVSWNDGAVQPLRWIWSFNEDHESVPFIRFHVDYAILSLGLLDAKALPKSWVGFEVQPANCSIKIGSRKSDLEIAYAFSNMTRSYLSPLNRKYDNSYWCFAAEIPGVKDTFLYRLGIHFGYPVEIMSYNCCFSYYHYAIEKLDVNCSERQSKTLYDTTSIPYFMGLILFCYFPILLLSFSSSIHETGKAGNDGSICKRNGYVSMDLEEVDDTICADDNRYFDFVYLDKTSPITSTSILCEFCGLAKRCPKLASRLRRALFIIFCPVMIYIKLIIYSSFQKETTLELINHGVPMNFLSMLGGFQRSHELFVPLLGGPFVLIILFYALSVVLVIFPENLEQVLEDGSAEFTSVDKLPLTLGLDSLEGFSHVQIGEERGFARVRALMVGRIYCIVNPKFWSHICCMYFARCRSFLTYVRMKLPRFLHYIAYIVLIPMFFLEFLIELLLCLLYYGIPLPWFIFTAFTGFGNTWIRTFRGRLGLMLTTSVSCFCTIIVGYLLLVPVLFYFSYSTIMIFSTGFNFVAEIIVFLFIAVIVYPSTAFGYLFFGTALFYYVLKQLRGIGETYFELLSDIVEVLMFLKAEPDQFRVVDGTLIVPIERSSTIQAIQNNRYMMQLSQQQHINISSSPSQSNDGLIHFKNKVPGIPRELFNYVVQKHRPVFLSVFKAFLHISLIVLLLFGTLRIASYAPSTSSQITEVMHVIFIVLIGSLPRALEITFSGSNKVVMKEIFLKQLESTILTYKKDTMVET